MDYFVVEGLTVRFGGLVAVDDFSTTVGRAEIHSVIGPNGAGKTSVINAITGLYPTEKGSIRLDAEELCGQAPHEVAARGIARTFQNVELFPEMTVLENVLVGAHLRMQYGMLASGFRARSFWRQERAEIERAEGILTIVGLADYRHHPAQRLPFALQRRIELARALALGPRLLLLDEPAAGMSSAEVADLNQLLVNLRDSTSLTILLVEHVMQVVMEISDGITVMQHGRKIAEGRPNEVRTNPDVVRAYLGASRSRARA